ncbi:MAG: hypothetical protein AAF280_14615 [Pseudomonadota bacterium]
MTMPDAPTQSSLVIVRAILASARPDQITRLMNDILNGPEQG